MKFSTTALVACAVSLAGKAFANNVLHARQVTSVIFSPVTTIYEGESATTDTDTSVLSDLLTAVTTSENSLETSQSVTVVGVTDLTTVYVTATPSTTSTSSRTISPTTSSTTTSSSSTSSTLSTVSVSTSHIMATVTLTRTLGEAATSDADSGIGGFYSSVTSTSDNAVITATGSMASFYSTNAVARAIPVSTITFLLYSVAGLFVIF